jgi:hypothetical protein
LTQYLFRLKTVPPPDGDDDGHSEYTPGEAEEAGDVADDGLILPEDILEGAVADVFDCPDERLAENSVVEGEDAQEIEDGGMLWRRKWMVNSFRMLLMVLVVRSRLMLLLFLV